MILMAWSFFIVLSLVVTSSQAFHTTPLSDLERGLNATTTTTTTTTTGLLIEPSSPLARSSVGSVEDESLTATEEEDEDEEEYAAQPARRGPGEQTVYVIEFETEADAGKGEGHRNRAGKLMPDDDSEGQSPLDPWSIVWYIGSFGGLVAFFLIVSCSEWCCRRGARPLSVPYTQRGEVIGGPGQPGSESPPPPYHLFAPPPYDSVNYAEIADKSGAAGEKLDIYVISMPIHPAALGPQRPQEQPAATTTQPSPA